MTEPPREDEQPASADGSDPPLTEPLEPRPPAGPPGGRVFSLEGRRAPALYLVGWILSVAGLFIAFLVGPQASNESIRTTLILIGALVVAVAWLVVAWAYQEQPLPDWIAEARSLPLVEEGARVLYEALPEGFRPEDLPPALETVEGLKDITFDDLDSPPAKSAGQDEQSGYNSDTRKGLDNLFQQNQ